MVCGGCSVSRAQKTWLWSLSGLLVSYAAVLCGHAMLPSRSSLRGHTKNGCVGDYGSLHCFINRSKMFSILFIAALDAQKKSSAELEILRRTLFHGPCALKNKEWESARATSALFRQFKEKDNRNGTYRQPSSFGYLAQNWKAISTTSTSS